MSTTLVKLPRELHLCIFEILDNDTSTCLGLTCKDFYTTYNEVQKRLNKNLLCERAGHSSHQAIFRMCLLHGWALI
jgi:hypothetical protein